MAQSEQAEREELEYLRLKQKSEAFASTPGGAATGVQMTPQARLTSDTERLATIGSAGFMGGVIGTFLPEVLTGTAGAVRQIPAGARVAPVLESAAIAARNAGRPMNAIQGAVGGLASETAGQVADAQGAGQLTQEAVRFAAGGLSPIPIEMAKKLVEWRTKVPALSYGSKIEKELLKGLAAKLEGRPQDISKEEADLLNKLVGDLRGGAKSDAAARELYGILQSGARGRMALGEAEAKNVLDRSYQEIRADLAKARATGITDVTEAGLRETAERAVGTAQMQRLNIGRDSDPTELGQTLRNAVVKNNEQQLARKQAEFKANEAARDAVVKQKEAAGVFIRDLKPYGELMKTLEAELAPGKHTDDVAKAFRRIMADLTTRKGPAPTLTERQRLGYDPKPEVKESPVSFQAVDELRRNLGQVFEGNPPEGYEAISAEVARRYYARISDLQKAYAGDAQTKLLDNYAAAMKDGSVFMSKPGQKFTAVDRLSPDMFNTDPAALPRQFFASQQGVANLIALTKDRAMVVQAGKDFAATELNNLNERQVREWMTKRRELLKALPEVRDSVLSYANTLQQAERIAQVAEQGVTKLKAAQTAGAGVVKSRNAEATALLGPKGEMFPVQNIEALLLKGDTAAWAQAAPLIHSQPGGKEKLASALQQALADKAETSIKGLQSYFESNVKPALVATRLMTPTQIDALAGRLAAIETMKVSEREKLGIGRRVVLQAFSGMAAGAPGRAAGSTLGMMVPPTTGYPVQQEQR